MRLIIDEITTVNICSYENFIDSKQGISGKNASKLSNNTNLFIYLGDNFSCMVIKFNFSSEYKPRCF